MHKLKFIFAVFIFIIITSFSLVAFASSYEVDSTNIDKGIISVKYFSDSTAIHKLKISKGTQVIYYTLENNVRDSFPLTFDNGEYEIKILENTTGQKYRTVYKKNVSLLLDNKQNVYLNSIQNINWDTSMDSIEYSNEVVYETKESLLQKIKVYELIIFNYSYDYDKYSNVKAAYYLPVIDDTFNSQRGICYDFSSLLASMLRSQGVPTKLVKGYSEYTNEYHAWNEVYINGKWYVIDTTYDAYYVKKGKEVTMLKDKSKYTKVYEY